MTMTSTRRDTSRARHATQQSRAQAKNVNLDDLEEIDTSKEIPRAHEPAFFKMKVAGVEYQFAGELLGFSTSEVDWHRDHEGMEYAPKNTKCQACRWLEAELYIRYSDAQDEPDCYAVITRGPSVVPGEKDFEAITFTESEFEVLEAFTVRKGTNTFIPRQNAMVLAQAAMADQRLKDVYTQMVAV